MKASSLFALALALFSTPSFALDPIGEAEDLRQPLAPALTEAAQSSQTTIRVRAARAWGRIQRPEVVTPLLSLLDDPELDVRAEALFALGQLGWDAALSGGREAEIAARVAQLLAHPQALLRLRAVEALGKIGLLETPSLVTHSLEDDDARIRAEAALALYRYRLVIKLRSPETPVADLPAPSAAKMLALAADPSPLVRRNVAYYFYRVKDPRGAEAMAMLAGDSDSDVRLFAVGALGKSGGPAQIENALAAARDEQSAVRIAAIGSVAALGAALRLDPAELAYDDSVHVRAAYAQALASAGPQALSALRALWADTRIVVKGETLKALVPLLAAQETDGSTQARALLDEAAASGSAELRALVPAASATLPPDARDEVLERASRDAAVQVRAAALDSWSSVEGAKAFGVIERALASPELSERGSAVAALGARKEPEVVSASWSCYQASTEEKWTELREELVKLWDPIPGDETTAMLRRAASDRAASVAAIARHALEARGVTDLPAPAPAQLSFSPYRELAFSRNPKIFLKTTRGDILLELYVKSAPIHVANLVGFVRDGKYDGLPVHRVVPNFVIQGGDPDGSGWGSAGYSVRAEINGRRFERGTLGMPRSTGFDTGGVQFFITHIPTPHLDGQYTVFGRVLRGLDVVDEIEQGDRVIHAEALGD